MSAGTVARGKGPSEVVARQVSRHTGHGECKADHLAIACRVARLTQYHGVRSRSLLILLQDRNGVQLRDADLHETCRWVTHDRFSSRAARL